MRIKLNKIQKTAIIDYLSKRLACYGIVSYKLEFKETPTYTYSYKITQELEPPALGIFRHALAKCTFSAEVWSFEKQENEIGHRHLVICGLAYEHVGHGSNGCEMDIKFYITDDGKIREDYR